MKLFAIVGWKNSGKTGLVERLVAEFTARGFTVSTLKHAHHRFDIDQPGRDSFRHRAAGAQQVMLSSSSRWALMCEVREGTEASFTDLLARLDPVDLVLVEGFKTEPMPKIEARRAATAQQMLADTDPEVLAVAADHAAQTDRPVFDLNDTAAIADFIAAHLGLKPPRPDRDGSGDCFALPPGVDWVPVDEALAMLKSGLAPLGGTETVALADLPGRILAEDAIARRASPPAANSAVDGYGFAHASAGTTLQLETGRAAPGAPWPGTVRPGHAIRILTGAPLPGGVDTVALQENVELGDGTVHVPALPRPGANTRKAGEDLNTDDVALHAGHRVRPQDIGLLASVGLSAALIRPRLRVGVLSTGDELTEPGEDPGHADIYDANRPMLLSLAAAWGFDAIDLGRAADTRDAVRAALDTAAARADVVLTSGGASAGDEDHIAALLSNAGSLNLWRIAVKPGRPLVLGHWQDRPLFGLPGNPVAAFVCALIFARPALARLSGQDWFEPVGTMRPAAFSKSKKPGRREYLRARLTDAGAVEVFKSEGSGRISGLSWATGLCELPDAAIDIRPGTPVQYLPFSEFGL